MEYYLKTAQTRIQNEAPCIHSFLHNLIRVIKMNRDVFGIVKVQYVSTSNERVYKIDFHVILFSHIGSNVQIVTCINKWIQNSFCRLTA